MKVSRRHLTTIVLFFFALWIGAWIVHQIWAAPMMALKAGTASDTLYWLVAKLLIWVVFPFAFLAWPLRKSLDFIGLGKGWLARGLVLGALFSLVWLCSSWAHAVWSHQHWQVPSDWTIALYAIVATPIIEEVMFRGFIQSSLDSSGTHPWVAATITSVLFLVAHMVGWAFQGVLAAQIFSVTPVTMILLGMALSYVRLRSQSLGASIMLHIANNALSAFIK